MRHLTERSFADSVGRPRPAAWPSSRGPAATRSSAPLAVDLIGLHALLGDDPWALNLLGVRQASIAGGTTEINKTVVGEHVLGLPR